MEEDITPAPKPPKARTRLNLQAMKEAVRGDSTVIQIEAQVHGPASSTPRKRASKESAAAPKGQFTNKGVDV